MNAADPLGLPTLLGDSVKTDRKTQVLEAVPLNAADPHDGPTVTGSGLLLDQPRRQVGSDGWR